MHSLFRSLDSEYLCIRQDHKGAIDFIVSAQPHQGPLHSIPTDSGAPVQLSPGLPALASAVSQECHGLALSDHGTP